MNEKQKRLLNSLKDKNLSKFVTKSFDYIELVPLIGRDDDNDEDVVDILLRTSIYLMRVKQLLSKRFPLEAPIPPSWDINIILPSVVREIISYNKKNITLFYILKSRLPFDTIVDTIEYGLRGPNLLTWHPY